MAIYVTAVDGMTAYEAADAMQMATQLLSQEGVVGVTGDDYLVEAQAVPDMTVKVNPGSCFVERDAHVDSDNTIKFWNVILTATDNVTISTANPSNPRIDLICVKIDTGASPDADASNVASLVAVAGTPAGSPSAPATPSNHLKIAEVYVDTGETAINTGDITDSREFIGLQLPYNEGYRLKDTGGALDAQLYEDSDGNITLISGKSGGGFRVNPVSEQAQYKGKASDSWVEIGSNSPSMFEFFMDEGGSVLTTGIKCWLEVPVDCIITQSTLTANASGSMVIDIWVDSYANYPPTDADTITGGNEPTLSTAQKDQDTTLSGWTKSLSAGDFIYINIDSCSTITQALLSLKVTKD